MVNLVLYSDQIVPRNSAIDRRLLAMLKDQRRGPRLGYIPSGPEPERHFFRQRKAYYARCNLDLCLFYDLDEPQGSEAMDALFACDAIHLSGGHTLGFLARLKRGAMFGHLRRWATDGGILIGTSAGAILMTPTIATDALFSGNRPEDVEDGDALALLPFEFFPHLGAKATYLADLVAYSRHTRRPIAACHDGDGLVVSQGAVECIGSPLWIAGGAVIKPDDVRLPGLRIAAS